MKEENYVLRWNRSKVYRGFIKQTQREVNALTYRSVLLLSRGLCCMVNSFQWRSVKCSSLPESLLHARCHFAQLIWSSSRQIKVDLLFFFSSQREWKTALFMFFWGMLVYTYIFLLCGLYVVCLCVCPVRLHWNGDAPLPQSLTGCCSHLL